MNADFKALGIKVGRLFVGYRTVRIGIDVGRAADAFPVVDRAARITADDLGVEAPGGPVVAVIVAGHDDHRLMVVRQVPEPRQRLFVGVHPDDHVGQQPLLLVRLGNGDLVQIDPVGVEKDHRSGSAISRRAPVRPRPGCPGGCRRRNAPGRR